MYSVLLTAQPAFPDCEGYGCETTNARGGSVIYVTNLNDAGTGSFREAVMSTGSRIVMFKVSGTIQLEDRITLAIANSNLRIAGQSAPGCGVQIKKYPFEIGKGVHDVVIQHLRFRPGFVSNAAWWVSSLSVYGSIYDNSQVTRNIVYDHCSFSFGPDENIGLWGDVDNINLQWCITSEGIESQSTIRHEDSKGMLIGCMWPGIASGMPDQRISVHHNFFASNAQRNALIKVRGPVQFVNNVIYNYRHFGTQISNTDGDGIGQAAGVKINLIGNYYKKGPNSSANRYAVGVDSYPNPAHTYVEDNLGPYRTSSSQSEWDIVGTGYTPEAQNGQYWTVPCPESDRKLTRWEMPNIPITIKSSTTNVNDVLSFSGATLPQRDSHDARMVTEYNTNTGTIDNITIWPVMCTSPAPTDTDNDGMPDTWETTYGFNPNNIADGNFDADTDGYTNIEEFLNGTVPVNVLNIDTLNSSSQKVSIYPNPLIGNVLYLNPSKLSGRYTLTDMLGSVIQEGEFINSQIRVSHMPRGTYFLKTQIRNSNQYLKLIKE